MENVTIIYYTSNMEDEIFEKKMRDNILKQSNGMSIISVSRKPIDFGKNICIGEQPVCYSNLWKQLLIGLKEAKTEFCIAAESDCLYPPEYFTFEPSVKDKVYHYDNVWVFWKNKNRFWKKPRMEGAQICGREYWIERLEKVLDGDTSWETMDNPNKIVRKIFKDYEKWSGTNPVLTFKTDKGISDKTSLCRTVRPVIKIPYWGTTLSIRENYFNE